MLRILPLVLFFAAATAVPAHAQWTAQQRADFTASCVPGCQQNPNVHPSRRGECSSYCDCALREAEALVPDFAQLERELGSVIETENVRRLKSVGPVCNQRVFGN